MNPTIGLVKNGESAKGFQHFLQKGRVNLEVTIYSNCLQVGLNFYSSDTAIFGEYIYSYGFAYGPFVHGTSWSFWMFISASVWNHMF